MKREPKATLTGSTDPDVVDAYYSNFISFDIDCYYMPRPYYRNNDPFDLSPKTAATLDITSNMVNIFSAIHEMNQFMYWFKNLPIILEGKNLSIIFSNLFGSYRSFL